MLESNYAPDTLIEFPEEFRRFYEMAAPNRNITLLVSDNKESA
jgi:hypothetical protein